MLSIKNPHWLTPTILTAQLLALSALTSACTPPERVFPDAGTTSSGTGGGGGGDLPPANCDGDGDGYFHPHASCDEKRGTAPADCDDSLSDVHPNAAPVCGDGVVNNCAALPDDVVTTLGIEELGLIAQQGVYLTPPGGFINEVSIAVEPGAPDTVFLVGGESASDIRLVRAKVGELPSATSIPVLQQPGYSYSNSDVMIRRVGGVLTIGTISYDGNFRPVPSFGTLDVNSADVMLSSYPAPMNCPQAVNAANPPAVRGFGDAGLFYYEVETTSAPQTVWGFVGSTSSSVTCKPLDQVGVAVGASSQIVANGGIAVGRSDTGLWTWELPFNYDDLHRYTPSAPVAGLHRILSRDTVGGVPVLLAYASGNGLTVEGMQCTGLTECTRLDAGTQTGVQVTTLDLVPLGSGALLIEGRGDFSAAPQFVVQFVGGNGAVLGGGVAVPLGAVEAQGYVVTDTAVVPPTIGREYYDVYLAYTNERVAAMQDEMAFVHARACTAK